MSPLYGYPDADADATEQSELDAAIRRRLNLPENQSLKGRVEAVLFLTGRALRLAELMELVGAPLEDVEFALIELMGDYNARPEASLEIDDTDGYILQVKEEYGDIVHRMMPLEISAAELRTLSAIAIKAPVRQSELIEWRGASAYDHIAALLKHKLITKKREGRSYTLNVTRHFYEYFKLTADKKALAALVPLMGLEGGRKEGATAPTPSGIRDLRDVEDARFDADGNPKK